MLVLLMETWKQLLKVVLIVLFIKVCITLLFEFWACDLEPIRRIPILGQQDRSTIC